MKNRNKIIIVSIAYVSLLMAALLYIIWTYAGSIRPVGMKEQLPTIAVGFVLAAISCLANLIVAIKYRNPLRSLSFVGLIISIVLLGLLVVPLGFSVGS